MNITLNGKRLKVSYNQFDESNGAEPGRRGEHENSLFFLCLPVHRMLGGDFESNAHTFRFQ